MEKIFFFLGSLFAFIGVSLGAFGAHALRDKLPTDLLTIFEVGVRYQMYHALALMGVALAYGLVPSGFMTIVGWLFVSGIILFSGSLYILALTGVRGWGAVTPVGGVLFLAGWLCLMISIWNK